MFQQTSRLKLILMMALLPVGCQRQPADTATGMPQSAPPAGYAFETPVRLVADGTVIAVEDPGYACPTMADVDGDGREDLVVGQFQNGHMQFFQNVAPTGEPPQLAAAEWIMTGEERAIVPGVW